MRTIMSITTQKGGTLKTTITTNLAGLLAKQGEKVLIIDTDAQGNVPLSFGQSPDQYPKTIYDVLVERLNPKYAIYPLYKNIDILPANDKLNFWEFKILANVHEYKNHFNLLTEMMNKFRVHDYDYILIDSPPHLGLMQGNILAFTDKVLIPFQPEAYSMRSLVKMIESIVLFRDKFNPRLQIGGVVGTLVDQRTGLHGDILQKARKFCYEQDIKMFNTVIPRKIGYAKSVAYQKAPATITGKDKKLVQAYKDLLGEITDVRF